jgi:hypothetical protein
VKRYATRSANGTADRAQLAKNSLDEYLKVIHYRIHMLFEQLRGGTTISESCQRTGNLIAFIAETRLRNPRIRCRVIRCTNSDLNLYIIARITASRRELLKSLTIVEELPTIVVQGRTSSTAHRATKDYPSRRRMERYLNSHTIVLEVCGLAPSAFGQILQLYAA